MSTHSIATTANHVPEHPPFDSVTDRYYLTNMHSHYANSILKLFGKTYESQLSEIKKGSTPTKTSIAKATRIIHALLETIAPSTKWVSENWLKAITGYGTTEELKNDEIPDKVAHSVSFSPTCQRNLVTKIYSSSKGDILLYRPCLSIESVELDKDSIRSMYVEAIESKQNQMYCKDELLLGWLSAISLLHNEDEVKQAQQDLINYVGGLDESLRLRMHAVSRLEEGSLPLSHWLLDELSKIDPTTNKSYIISMLCQASNPKVLINPLLFEKFSNLVRKATDLTLIKNVIEEVSNQVVQDEAKNVLPSQRKDTIPKADLGLVSGDAEAVQKESERVGLDFTRIELTEQSVNSSMTVPSRPKPQSPSLSNLPMKSSSHKRKLREWDETTEHLVSILQSFRGAAEQSHIEDEKQVTFNIEAAKKIGLISVEIEKDKTQTQQLLESNEKKATELALKLAEVKALQETLIKATQQIDEDMKNRWLSQPEVQEKLKRSLLEDPKVCEELKLPSVSERDQWRQRGEELEQQAKANREALAMLTAREKENTQQVQDLEARLESEKKQTEVYRGRTEYMAMQMGKQSDDKRPSIITDNHNLAIAMAKNPPAVITAEVPSQP